MTVATGLAPDVVMGMDDRMLVTIIDVIDEQNERRAGGRR